MLLLLLLLRLRVRSGWRINVLVGTDTSGFEGLGGQLLVLVGDHVHAQREVIDAGLLTSQIKDTDLGVGNTTVEPGLRVGLYPTHPVSNRPPHSTYQNNKSIQAPVKPRRHIFPSLRSFACHNRCWRCRSPHKRASRSKIHRTRKTLT